MSYDVSLVIDTGGSEPAEVVDVGNMTSNVAPMWRKALPPDGIAGLHGRRCADVTGQLQLAVAHMENHPDFYRAMNPPNGWGDYESALDYLRKLRDAAAAHPLTTIEVSR